MQLSKCKGIGPTLKARLEKLGLHTFFDILVHRPIRYEDRVTLWPLATLKEHTPCLVKGTIQAVTQEVRNKRKWLQVIIADATGVLVLRWLHFTPQQKERFQVGLCVECYGTPRRLQRDWIMVQPDYQILSQDIEGTKKLVYTAVYPTVAGLSQKILRKLVQEALHWCAGEPEILPFFIQEQLGVENFLSTVQALHCKALSSKQEPDLKRLIVEECLAQQLALMRTKANNMQAYPLKRPEGLANALLKQLGFQLTAAQQRVVKEIWCDLEQETPMMRLLQGDVGSGKTVVAALALLSALASGGQGALMVPTELLAEQHAKKLNSWFTPLQLRVVCLTGQLNASERVKVLTSIQRGEPMVVVGTQALFQEAVQFGALRLVIIDEQHRFGVTQRSLLAQKGTARKPHQLLMTATPIPRTLAMALSAELAVSSIDSLPPGRTPIKTVVLSNRRRAEVIERVLSAIAEGRQVYWVCPLIENSEQLQVEAIENLAKQLHTLMPSVNLGVIHGRLPVELKEQVMQAFVEKKTQLLVATTVIEVGVDVPNASVMIIENAERMGLAQLHQLRGRVGRGSIESFCVLLFQEPLSLLAKKRLAIIREYQDGFLIAEHDLALRGPGDFLGTRQSGVWKLRIADFQRDMGIFQTVQGVLPSIPEPLQQQLVKRWFSTSLEYIQA